MDEKNNFNQILEDKKLVGHGSGASIVSNDWTDNNQKPLRNSLSSSSSHPIFLKMIEASRLSEALCPLEEFERHTNHQDQRWNAESTTNQLART